MINGQLSLDCGVGGFLSSNSPPKEANKSIHITDGRLSLPSPPSHGGRVTTRSAMHY